MVVFPQNGSDFDDEIHEPETPGVYTRSNFLCIGWHEIL